MSGCCAVGMCGIGWQMIKPWAASKAKPADGELMRRWVASKVEMDGKVMMRWAASNAEVDGTCPQIREASCSP